MKKKVLTGILASLMLFNMTGCKKSVNIKELENEDYATTVELANQEKESIKYRRQIENVAEKLEYGYELQQVDSKKKAELTSAMQTIQNEYGSAVYMANSHITAEQYNTMKGVIDDKVLTYKSIAQIGTLKGYYFVDVNYTVTPQSLGSVKENTKYLGINGAFQDDGYGNVTFNPTFVAKYLNSAKIAKQAEELEATKYKRADKSKEIVINNDEKKDTGIKNTRPSTPSIILASKSLGTSVGTTICMPELTMVYNPAPKRGTLSGNGISLQGDKTMYQYGYDRSKMTGSLYMRYVFKQSITDNSKVEFVNAYVMNWKLNEAPKEDKEVIIPEFVETNATKLLERTDRLVANSDLRGLMNGEVVLDVGNAVLCGYLSNNAFIGKHRSTLDEVVGRDEARNSYLVKFHTVKEIGAKGSADYGKYRLDGYFVMTQQDLDFKMTDYVYTSVETLREPSVSIDDTITLQLASLNLAGKIGTTTKKQIEQLLDTYYTACTGGGASGKERWKTVEGKEISPNDIYNKDTKLLSTARRKYLTTSAVSWTERYGKNTETKMSGFVTEWMGGTENQAEFVTQELIKYEGKDRGLYLKNYYLVSNYNGNYVVDEMRVLESKDVNGAELQAIEEKIANKESFSVESPDNSVKTNNLATEKKAAEQTTTATNNSNSSTAREPVGKNIRAE